MGKRRLPKEVILDGKFLIDKVLYEDEKSITYLAKHLDLQFEVAVKEFFPKEYAKRGQDLDFTIYPFNEEAEKDFRRELSLFAEEVRSFAKCRDDAKVVNVMAMFDENGTAYAVADYEAGDAMERFFRGEVYYEEAIGEELVEESAEEQIEEVSQEDTQEKEDIWADVDKLLEENRRRQEEKLEEERLASSKSKEVITEKPNEKSSSFGGFVGFLMLAALIGFLIFGGNYEEDCYNNGGYEIMYYEHWDIVKKEHYSLGGNLEWAIWYDGDERTQEIQYGTPRKSNWSVLIDYVLGDGDNESKTVYFRDEYNNVVFLWVEVDDEIVSEKIYDYEKYNEYYQE